MSIKYLIPITVVFTLLISLTSVRAYLETNFYFTMAPNSTYCLSTILPSDLGFLEDDKYTMAIDSGFETNINFIETEAGKNNAIKVPICFSSKNKNNGEFADYKIRTSGTKFSPFEWKGGICVSNKTQDTDKDSSKYEKNPCEIVNGLSDLFWMDIFPEQAITVPGQEETFYIEILPSVDMEIDLTINSNAGININNSYLRLKQYERKQIELRVNPTLKGEYYLNATAKAIFNRQYCDLPFCKKEIGAKILVDGGKKIQGWSFLVLPRFLSAYNQKPIEYVAIIENNQEDRNFSIDLGLPPGLLSDTKSISGIVRKSERKEFRFNITFAENIPQKYTIDFTATRGRNRSAGLFPAEGDTERVLTAFLSLYESADDLKSQWNSIRDQVDDKTRAEIDDLVNKYLIDLKDGGFSPDDYTKIRNKINETSTKTKTEKTPASTTSPANQSEQMPVVVLILIPVVVIIILLVLMFARRKRV
ncbi:MAG: hypothetical protein HY512_00505 [Candidatus Aenigmarchaeota archaeon]|nr:hypothetical protein [Candidatus Aenigmarchaeota archaeon]